MCNNNIQADENRYAYFNTQCNDTSVHKNTFKILNNMLSTISHFLEYNIKEDVMFVTRPPGHHCSHDNISGFLLF